MPTPVINSTKQIDSWSSNSDALTLRDPTEIHVNRFCVTARFSSDLDCIAMNSTTPIVKTDAETMVAITWPQELARLPASKRIAELNNGSAINQAKFAEVCMFIFSTNLHHQLIWSGENDKLSQ